MCTGKSNRLIASITGTITFNCKINSTDSRPICSYSNASLWDRTGSSSGLRSIDKRRDRLAPYSITDEDLIGNVVDGTGATTDCPEIRSYQHQPQHHGFAQMTTRLLCCGGGWMDATTLKLFVLQLIKNTTCTVVQDNTRQPTTKTTTTAKTTAVHS